MPSEPREWHEGACYHVMARGNRRGAIYRSSDDYELFLSLLKRVQRRKPFFLHSFCLMTNHFHLQFTTQDVPIWKIMQPLMNSYARIFNRKHGYHGHLFEARYVSKMIEDEIYFLEVSRYIHLNPVKATLVSEPLAYPYSSYRAYMETEDAVEHARAEAEDLEEIRAALTGATGANAPFPAAAAPAQAAPSVAGGPQAFEIRVNGHTYDVTIEKRR